MGLFGTGLRRICAVVAASTAEEMSKLVRSALRQTRTVELRLDWLRSDAERARFLDWLAASQPGHATFLATCRRASCFPYTTLSALRICLEASTRQPTAESMP